MPVRPPVYPALLALNLLAALACGGGGRDAGPVPPPPPADPAPTPAPASGTAPTGTVSFRDLPPVPEGDLAEITLAYGDIRASTPAGAPASETAARSGEGFEVVGHPFDAFDDDPATAWMEDMPGYGEGATISWTFTPHKIYSDTLRLEIRNGCQENEIALAEHGAPERVRVRFPEASPPAPPHEIVLQKRIGWQRFDIPLPQQPGKKGIYPRIELEIVSAHIGSEAETSCIAEIQTVGRAVALGAHEERWLEALRFDTKRWLRERAEARAEDAAREAFFAALPEGYPFAGRGGSPSPAAAPSPEAFDAAFEAARAEVADMGNWEGSWNLPDVPGFLPDGLAPGCDIPLALVDVRAAAWTAVPEGQPIHTRSYPLRFDEYVGELSGTVETFPYRLRRDADGQVTALQRLTVRDEGMRTSRPGPCTSILRYEGGLLAEVTSWQQAPFDDSGEIPSDLLREIVRFEHEGGRITGWTRQGWTLPGPTPQGAPAPPVLTAARATLGR